MFEQDTGCFKLLEKRSNLCYSVQDQLLKCYLAFASELFYAYHFKVVLFSNYKFNLCENDI